MTENFEHEMELFRAKLAADLENYKAKLQGDIELWRAEDQRKVEAWRAGREFDLVAHKSIVEFALLALKGVVFINGGAAIAILAFLGSIWDVGDSGAQAATMKAAPALWFFVSGAGAGVLAAALSYLSQVSFAELHQNDEGGRDWSLLVGNSFRLAAVLAAAGGLAVFGIGTSFAIRAFEGGMR